MLIHEDELPDGMTKFEYDAWYEASQVVDGVRIGEKPVTVPLNISLPLPMILALKNRRSKVGVPVSRQVQDAIRDYFTKLEENNV